MLWKMQWFALQSMGHTNHKVPVYATRNVQTQLKSTVKETKKSSLSLLRPTKVFLDTDIATLTMNFMLPVPEASVPAVEICSDKSVAGMTKGGGGEEMAP